MNDKKILFFDIDGTLLTPPPYSIPRSTRLALSKAKEEGHLLFINTGRTTPMLPDIIKDLGFDGYVCGCGTQIYMHDELLHFSTIPNPLCREIVQKLREYKISAIFEAPKSLLYDGGSCAQSPLLKSLKNEFPIEDLALYEGSKKDTYTFIKFLIQSKPGADFAAFREFCEDKFVWFDHGDQFVEITQKEFSKATGIQFLLDKLDIPLENSYVFGDSVNDLPMLKYAGTSIAMGNSMKEILPYCTYQTTDIRDDGIYRAMVHFGLISE